MVMFFLPGLQCCRKAGNVKCKNTCQMVGFHLSLIVSAHEKPCSWNKSSSVLFVFSVYHNDFSICSLENWRTGDRACIVSIS